MTARDRRGWRGLSASVLAAAIARPVRSPHPVRPSGDRALRGGSGLDAWAGPRPALVGGVPARQADPTACGAAVLLVLAAGGDDRVEQWVGAGRTGGRPSPPEVPPGVAPTTAAGRLSAAQRRVHQRARSRAVGSVPWPAALGTPPWTAAREARFPGVRYRSVPLDDAADGARHLLAAAHGATLAGVPVPLYTGGDLGHGLTTAVPRHVVLALPAEGTGRGLDGGGRRALDVYEPSSATVRQVALEDLVGRQEPHPALGGWSHVCWVLLPERIAPVGADVHTGTTHPNRRRDMSIGADTGPVQDPEEHEPTPDTVADPEDYDPQLEVEDPVREADPADVAEQTLELPDDDEVPEGELGAGAPDDEPA